MRLVVVLARDSKVRHYAVELGIRTRSLCGQVQHEGVILPVSQIRGQWDLAVDADGMDTVRPICGTCASTWAKEWVPWVRAVKAGERPPARRATG